MKISQITAAVTIGLVAALIAASAQAVPTIFKNGKQLTEAEIIELMEQNQLPHTIGNQTYEDGKFIMSTDSKDPVVVATAKKTVQRTQEKAYQDREFYLTGKPAEKLSNNEDFPQEFRDWLSDDDREHIHISEIAAATGKSVDYWDNEYDNYKEHLAEKAATRPNGTNKATDYTDFIKDAYDRLKDSE